MARGLQARVLFGASALLVWGCAGRAPTASSVPQPRPEVRHHDAGTAATVTSRAGASLRPAAALQPPPPAAPSHPLDVLFGGALRLVGYDVDAPLWRPGGTLTVTWYWRCERPVANGWRLFTHADDLQGPRTNFDRVGSVRRTRPPWEWRPGEQVRDTQTIELPPDWDSPTVRLYLGLWRDADRLRIEPATASDGTRRTLALELPTGWRPPNASYPRSPKRARPEAHTP